MKIDYNKKYFTEEEKYKIKVETEKLNQEHPRHIPILVQLDSRILNMEKMKYLFSEEITLNTCISTLKKKLINLNPSDTLIISTVNLSTDTATPLEISSRILRDVYEKLKDPETNMLIFKVSRQTTYKWVKGIASYYLGYE
jgi:hypothetical protein